MNYLKSLKALTTALCVLLSLPASASIITEEWSAILTSADHNNLPEGKYIPGK